MREKGTPSNRPIAKGMGPKPEPFYFDQILRDRGFQPSPNRPVGRVIRALSGIMRKGNVFKGTF